MSGKCRPSLLKKTLENVKRSNLSQADKDCIQAVFERFIPKKPIPLKDNYTGKIVSYGCPNCNNTDLGNNEFKNKHCENCGQALDWSDTE